MCWINNDFENKVIREIKKKKKEKPYLGISMKTTRFFYRKN